MDLIEDNIKTASQLIHYGSLKATDNLKNLNSNLSILSFLDELKFKDNRDFDYAVYFNTANFANEDDNAPIQFLYIGYGKDRTLLRMSIGHLEADNLSLEYGAVLEIEESEISWKKGGEFSPPVITKTETPNQIQYSDKIKVLDEKTFLATSLDYIHEFEQVTIVELNDTGE